MDQRELARLRFQHQRLLSSPFSRAADAVQWLGAVQSQDYEGARWAVGLRSAGLDDAAVEAACDAGDILRTHLMRPTWHFVAAEDLRWMLALTAPRLKHRLETADRKIGLDEEIYARCNAVMERALRDGAQLTRQELAAALRQGGMEPGGVQRLAHIVIRAEQDGILCSGARRGKQMTYALLHERVKASRQLSGDEALAELARRYFRSHGPATLADFGWWAWLPAAEARRGLDLARAQFQSADLDGKTCWYAEEAAEAFASPAAYLLPNFDEVVGSYKDHRPSVDPRYWAEWESYYTLFTHHLLIDGLIVGGWKRLPKKDGREVKIRLFGRLTGAEEEAVLAAAGRYERFLDCRVTVTWAK